MSVYHDLFQSWEDIQREYETKAAEPGEVLFAAYEYESYSGESLVIFKHKGRLYLNEGSHCSCFGLEGQWEPEEITVGVLRRMVDAIIEQDWGDSLRMRHKQHLVEVVELLESGW